MTVQSENALEQGLIRTLQENSYEYVEIKEEENLRSNFKLQLEKHNRKALEDVGRTGFTESEFDKLTGTAAPAKQSTVSATAVQPQHQTASQAHAN